MPGFLEQNPRLAWSDLEAGAESREQILAHLQAARDYEDQIMDVTLAASVDEFFHEVVTDALSAVDLDA